MAPGVAVVAVAAGGRSGKRGGESIADFHIGTGIGGDGRIHLHDNQVIRAAIGVGGSGFQNGVDVVGAQRSGDAGSRQGNIAAGGADGEQISASGIHIRRGLLRSEFDKFHLFGGVGRGGDDDVVEGGEVVGADLLVLGGILRKRRADPHAGTVVVVFVGGGVGARHGAHAVAEDGVVGGRFNDAAGVVVGDGIVEGIPVVGVVAGHVFKVKNFREIVEAIAGNHGRAQ